MKKLASRIAFLLSLMVVLGSCTGSKDVVSKGFIQKRKYQKGWHVDIPKRERAQPTARLAMERLHPRTNTSFALPVALAEPQSNPAASSAPLTASAASAVQFTQRMANRSPWSYPGELVRTARQQALAATRPIATPDGEPTGTNTLAILGFIFAFLFSLVGLILSIIALGQIKRTGERGHGLAVAGIIISVVSLLIAIAFLA